MIEEKLNTTAFKTFEYHPVNTTQLCLLTKEGKCYTSHGDVRLDPQYLCEIDIPTGAERKRMRVPGEPSPFQYPPTVPKIIVSNRQRYEQVIFVNSNATLFSVDWQNLRSTV